MRVIRLLVILPMFLTFLATASAQDALKKPPTTAAATRPTTRPATRPIVRPVTRPAPTLKPVPETLEDLRALQSQVRAVVAKVAPAVVGLRVGFGQGSGVIISEDGYVLTAGHVSGTPGKDVNILLANGKSVKGTTLGVNYGVDSGLIKINEPPPGGGKWAFADMGKSVTLRKGQWCVALGHPGGYKNGRTPPLRLGRVLDTRGTFLRTDCTLVGGDSGGPLFDLDGRVIGIHSRIGGTLNDNMHVPVDTYADTWDRLAMSDSWGATILGAATGAYLGVQVDPEADNCKLGEVFPNSPAEKAGLKAGDVIKTFNGQRIEHFGDLMIQLGQRKPGDEVEIALTRDDEQLKLKVTIGKRPTQ